MKRAVVISFSVLAIGPILLLMILSISKSWYWPLLWPQQWSLRAWHYVFSREAAVANALWTSVIIALLVAAAAVAVALPAARAIVIHRFRGKGAVLFLLSLPIIAPPIASTMGLHRIMTGYGLTDSLLGVAVAHLIPALPYAVLALMGSFGRLDRDFESQARMLGASPAQVWRHVTIPAIAPGLGIAFCFAFLISWSQYLLTLLIGGGTVTTLPLELVSFQRGGDEAITAALSLVFLAPAVFVMAIVRRYLRD